MAGLAPLNYATIQAWAYLMDIRELEPHEVRALIYLDGVLLEKTEKEEQVQEEVSSEPRKYPEWTSKKKA